MHIDYSPKDSTIEISGEPPELLEFGDAFFRGNKFTMDGRKSSNEFYPEALERLVFMPVTESEARLTVTVDERQLLLSGGGESTRKLGQSLLNFFSGEPSEGQHFHLDYFDFEENGILAPTDFHLIFTCERKVS